MSVTKRLKNISLFKSIKDKEELLAKIEEIVVEKEFPKGSYIIKEGEVGTSVFILSKGTVSIEKKTVMGDTFSLANLNEDSNVFFGELALLNNDRRSASVFAVTDTVCYLIDRDDFNRFCRENPYIGYLIIRDVAASLASKLRKTTDDNLILINALCCEEAT